MVLTLVAPDAEENYIRVELSEEEWRGGKLCWERRKGGQFLISIQLNLIITWKLCAEDAAFISDSDAFGLKRTKIFLCSVIVIQNLFNFICMKMFHMINLWRRMTERNILLLKSAISAAKSMSPLKNKYEEVFQEIHKITNMTNETKHFEI